jgi:hypothetical protein
VLSDAGVDYRTNAFDGPVINAPGADAATRRDGRYCTLSFLVVALGFRDSGRANYCSTGGFGLPRRMLMPTIGPYTLMPKS